VSAGGRGWSALPIAFAAYVLLVLAAAWPLSSRIRTSLPGDPSGDTGVYVWNQWVFRHELIEHGRNPLYTTHILVPGPPVDLALHNYTVFQDILGLALWPLLGTVGAFNATWLIMQALAGLGVFLLAGRVTTRAPVAWLAGATFACSPIVVARSTAHQSLVAAAPLAFFLHFALRAADERTLRHAALAGVMAAWAATCDAYYGIYCALMLAMVIGARAIFWTRDRAIARPDRIGSAVTVLMAIPAVAALAVVATGGGTFTLLGVSVRARSLYTPMLVLTALGLLRLGLALRQRGRWRVHFGDRFQLVQLAIGGAICAALLLPLLDAARARVAGGGSLQLPVLWRSSSPGVDLLSFVLPNPNHPLAPDSFRAFVSTRPEGFAEGVVSIPYALLGVLLVAVRTRHVPPREWVALAIGFALLALGPFLIIAHVNTAIPAPWAIGRYVPILGAARTPARFAIPMMIALAVAFAWAVDRLGLRREVLAAVMAVLAFELWPVPRVTATARVPRPYEVISADARDIAVLDLPFGIRDGTDEIGRLNTATLFYQTAHAKRTVAGYLSRIPAPAFAAASQDAVLGVLARLSARQTVSQQEWRLAIASWPELVDRASIGYLVVEDARIPPDLRRFVTELQLSRLSGADGFTVFAATRCGPFRGCHKPAELIPFLGLLRRFVATTRFEFADMGTPRCSESQELRADLSQPFQKRD
jgi:hypothetical protein